MQSFSTLTAEWSSTMAIFNRMMKRSSAWAPYTRRVVDSRMH